MAEAWGAAGDSSYDVRVWDDEAVVFVAATADTHHLSSSATTVLLALRAEPGQVRDARAWYDILVADDAVAVAEDPVEPRLELPEFESLLLGLERIGVAVRHPA